MNSSEQTLGCPPVGAWALGPSAWLWRSAAALAGGEPVSIISTTDVGALVLAAVLLVLFALTGRQIARWEGVVFLLYYAAYTAYLILASQAHDVLPQFSAVMLYFVVPLTVITMGVSLFQHRRTGQAS